jgi:transaldolase
MKVKLFADGADKATMIKMAGNPTISGLTTNPTLLRKAGVENYEKFAKDVLSAITEKSVSFEVISDDFDEMLKQARTISSWGNNVYVKIPITNSRGVYSPSLIKTLNQEGIKINVTAITQVHQVKFVLDNLPSKKGVYISVFAGRIADAGADYLKIMKEAVELVKDTDIEIIWASPRELYNVVQADSIGCHIITCTTDILNKLPLLGKDLDEYSRETAEMFLNDAKQSGYTL